MPRKHQAIFYYRLLMTVIALLLPLISLVLLGSLWLWQNGYVLYWALAACSITLITYAIERWVLRFDATDTIAPAGAKLAEQPNPSWSVREAAAWASVVELSKEVKPLALESRDEVFDLGVRTIETVARSMHPGEEHALWKFTLPEALALVERVSSKLGVFVTDKIPLGDRMTVGQFLRLYRWRSVINVAEQAYDLWRIIRLMNPAAAATNEVREQLTRRAYEWGREELARRLVQAYVREIGRAAIDLYSGRMRLVGGASTSRAEVVSTGERAEQPPLNILVASVGSDDARTIKDRLASAQTDGSAAFQLFEYPAVATPQALPAFLKAADQSDLLIWVTNAGTNLDHERALLDEVRKQAASRVNRKPQPMLGVFIDPAGLQLNGSSAGQTSQDNQSSIPLASISEKLGLTLAQMISLTSPADTIALEEHTESLTPDARHAQELRLSQGRKTSRSWGRIFSQVFNAGKALTSRGD